MLLPLDLLTKMPSLHERRRTTNTTSPAYRTQFPDEQASVYARLVKEGNHSFFVVEAENLETGWRVWGYLKLPQCVFPVLFGASLHDLQATGWQWDKSFGRQPWPVTRCNHFQSYQRAERVESRAAMAGA